MHKGKSQPKKEEQKGLDTILFFVPENYEKIFAKYFFIYSQTDNSMIMKKISICFSLLFVTMCFSQQQLATIRQKQDSVKLESFLKVGTSLFDIYVGAELVIRKDFTVNVETGLNAIGFKVVEKRNDYLEEKRNSWRMNFTDNDFGFYFAKSEFRWNYSFQKRHKNGKRQKEIQAIILLYK